MATQPPPANILLSIEDFKNLLLKIYMLEKRIGFLEAELAKTDAGVASIRPGPQNEGAGG
ncbi:MAG: hypothetical protein V3V32_04510 [Dehalococcoidia bacterium]